MNMPYNVVNYPVSPSQLLRQVYGLDVGRSRVKGACGDGKVEIIPSYVWPVPDGENPFEVKAQGLDKENLVVTYYEQGQDGHWRGKSFYVGELARKKSRGRGRVWVDDKKHDYVRVLGLTLLFLLGAQGDTHIATGVPIEEYGRQKDSLKDSFMGTHMIAVNGIQRTINVKTCGVQVEGASYIYVTERFEGLLRVIDPGAKTTNFSTFYDGEYIPEESGTLPYGWETHLPGGEDVNLFASRLVSDLSGRGWERGDTIEVIGGRAADLVEPLKRNSFTGAVVPNHIDPTYANCLGYLTAVKEHLGIDTEEA